MTRPRLCLCSYHERLRFAAWRRKADRLAKDKAAARSRSHDGLGDVFDRGIERRACSLFAAIFARLQGANPTGMAGRIVCAAAKVYGGDFEGAASELADLEADERESQALNPDERRCPRKGDPEPTEDAPGEDEPDLFESGGAA